MSTLLQPFRIPPYFALVIRAIGVVRSSLHTVALILSSFLTEDVIRLQTQLEGIALVGNPEFAIIDEAYPYIARKLMTDNSPRLKAALRYMVYGSEGSFDAEKLIDLLQALEKFTAVRDEGDGSSFKVDGVRGSTNFGKAGDFSGTQQLTKREPGKINLISNDGGYSEVMGINLRGDGQNERDQRTVREALRFFFSPEGKVFREFISEEIVTFVDASGREASQEVMMAMGLNNLPMPSLIRAMNPTLSAEDKRVSSLERRASVNPMFDSHPHLPLCFPLNVTDGTTNEKTISISCGRLGWSTFSHR